MPQHAVTLAAVLLAACGGNAVAPLDAPPPDAGACSNGPGWTDAPALALGPAQETATGAVDGKIYVIGGFDGALAVLDRVQVFDTRTCTWSLGPALPRAVHHANVAAVDGRIYVLGALAGTTFTAIGDSWSWAPATESAWTDLASMPAGTERGAAIIGAIGARIYLAGGLRGSSAVALVTAYDTATATWETALPSLPEPRDHGCGGVVGDALYVIGGRGGSIEGTSDSVLAYAAGGSWQSRAAMPTARGGTACGVIDGRIFVVGGEGNAAAPSGVFSETEVYIASEDRWEALAPMPIPRHGMGAAAWDGRLYVPGGATRQAFGAVATHQVFTP